MKLLIKLIVILFTILVLYSCQNQRTIYINEHKLVVEVADTEKERQKGLMFRREMDINKGMLFVFDEVKVVSFWMKNTFLPLSIAFIAANNKILKISKMASLDDVTPHSSYYPIKYALEVNQGWFERHGIGIGDIVKGLKQ